MAPATLAARLRRIAAIVRAPVLDDTRRNLARSWARVPEAYRSPRQMLGRAGNGCSATIGAMPRCDFACAGCYLGEAANTVPPEPLEAIKAQLRAVRPAMGDAGNVQLTDGEITLRPVEELIELLRYARELRLIPMLMTHGDTFRRRPGLLERLMVEGGLVEVSIHVDTTQRGRLGDAYRRARTEEELMPLREEFAAMIRDAKRRTGLPLRAATTMTVTAGNLAGVPAVMRWLLRNTDAFRLVSFQPVAQVGRTEPGLGGGVTVEALWAKIAEATAPGRGAEAAERGQLWVGHPGCNRYMQGVVWQEGDADPAFHPLREEGDATDAAIVDGFLARFGGISFRMDAPWERLARQLGVLLHAPAFVLRSLPRFTWHWLRRLGAGRPLHALCALLGGRARVSTFLVISHHFMSREDAETPTGRERLALCVFHVPIDGELRPMCEVNTTGLRDGYYDRLRQRRALPVLAAEG